jgi:molybdopterin synthase sulfur carrier subunit
LSVIDESAPSSCLLVTFSVNALFFAAYRDLVGSGSIAVELPTGATVADLVAELRGRGAPFDGLPAEPAVAVNRTYAFLDEPLASDDEVAFIPPVAGG